MTFSSYTWLYRCKCGACGSILWIDVPARVTCMCTKTWIESDGTTGGEALEATDKEMFLDWKAGTGEAAEFTEKLKV